jgi:hypothetical protein
VLNAGDPPYKQFPEENHDETQHTMEFPHNIGMHCSGFVFRLRAA